MLALVSVAVAALAVTRLTGRTSHSVDTAWWLFVVMAIVLAIDLSRTVISLRTARQYGSEALRSNAIHFGSDFAGTLAVLAGLAAAAAGYPAGDSIAALFVAALVLLAAGRLIRRNVDVLMDRAPAEAEAAARAAIAGDRAADLALPASPPPGRRAHVRRRRDLRAARRRGRSGPRGRRPGGGRARRRAARQRRRRPRRADEPTRRRSETARSQPR